MGRTRSHGWEILCIIDESQSRIADQSEMLLRDEKLRVAIERYSAIRREGDSNVVPIDEVVACQLLECNALLFEVERSLRRRCPAAESF